MGRDGVLFNKTFTTLIAYPAGKTAPSYAVPDGVTAIADSAFAECSRLIAITLPAGITAIGEGAFASCSSLIAIQVDNANKAFAGRDGVLFNKTFTTLIAYPAGKTAPSYAVPDGVTTIGDRAFAGCIRLIAITLPAGITAIGDRAFASCESLIAITLPAGLTSIADSAFAGCIRLIAISLPVDLTSIGDRAFAGCIRLSTITLPAGITSIGDYAFASCNSLIAITLPADVTAIGDSAFYECSSLIAIQVDNASKAFAGRDGVLFNKTFTTLIAYPAGKTAPSYAVPDGVTAIGERVFNECGSLIAISLQALKPPVLGDYGLGISGSAASLNSYKNATGWKEHADRIRAAGN